MCVLSENRVCHIAFYCFRLCDISVMQRGKHAYCQRIASSLSCVLSITQKSVASYQLSFQWFSKCLAELVANSSQVGRKNLLEITPKLCFQQQKRKPPGGGHDVLRRAAFLLNISQRRILEPDAGRIWCFSSGW